MLDRAEERIKTKHYFDVNKIHIIKKLQQEIQGYLDQVQPIPYLDDISTKIIKRLNDIFDILMEEWNECCEQ